MSRSVTGIALFIFCTGLSSAIAYREVVVRPRLEAEKAQQQQAEAQRQADLERKRDAAAQAAQDAEAKKVAEAEEARVQAEAAQARALAAKRAAEPPQPHDDGRYWLGCNLKLTTQPTYTEQGAEWKDDNIIVFPRRGPITDSSVDVAIYDRSKKYTRDDGTWSVRQDYIEREIGISTEDDYNIGHVRDMVYQKIDRRTLVMTIEHNDIIEWRGQCTELPPAKRPVIVDPKL